MPSYYDIPLPGTAIVPNLSVEDVNKFQKLPFYLVKNEVRRFPMYKTWDVLFGNKKWTPNMGSLMRGVRPEYSPIGDSFVYPMPITGTPNKNVFETQESTEEAFLRLHRFESKQFHFLPSFQDFRENQLQWNHDDIIRQIALFNERFIRGTVFYRSPNIIVAGNNGSVAALGQSELATGVPQADFTFTIVGGVPVPSVPNNGKTTGFMQALASAIGQSLTLKLLYKCCSFLDDDLGALPFEGTLNTPKENELVKGKYVVICGTDAWRQFTWDPDVANLKSINLDLLFDDFKGSLFGMLTCKPERFPLRFGDDGTFYAPQVMDAETKKTRPNPQYTDLNIAKYEVAFIMGADAWSTITVGPPPKEFATKSMSAEKFYSLRWNGEVQMTDQCLIRYPDGSIDLNRYGTQLQLISQAVFGALAGEVNNCIPIVFRRRRIATT